MRCGNGNGVGDGGVEVTTGEMRPNFESRLMPGLNVFHDD